MVPGGNGHAHIAQLSWRNDASGETGVTSRAEMVAFVKTNGTNSVWCPDRSGGPSAWVHVNREGLTEYVQTVADGRWTNNLLSLPTF